MATVKSIINPIANRTRLLINMASGTASALTGAILGFVFMPIFLHFFGPAGLGITGLLAILMGLTRILDMGLSASVNRNIAKFSCSSTRIDAIPDLLRTFEILFVLWGGLMLLIALVLSPWLSTWLNISESQGNGTIIFIILAACAFSRWGAGLYQSCLLGIEKQVLCNTIRIFELFSLYGVGVGLLYWQRINITQYLIWILINTVVFGVISAVWTWYLIPGKIKSFLRGRFRFEYISETWKFAAGLAGITIASTLFGYMDRLIVNWKSLILLGFYTPAISLAIQASGLFGTSAFTAAYPNFTRLHEKKDSSGTIHHYFFLVSIIGALAFSFLCFLHMYTPNILSVWFPKNTNNIHQILSPILLWCAFGPIINTLAIPGYTLQLAHGRPKWALICTGVLVPFAAVGYYWQLGQNGLKGLVICMATIYSLTMIFSLLITHIKFLKGQTIRFIITVFSVAGLVVLVAMLCRMIPYPESASRIIRAGWLGGIFVVIAGVSAGLALSLNWLIQRVTNTTTHTTPELIND